ncbi:MAG: cytochrome c [Planctomycetia bacterium]|nr:cytochrome c [Planctomycetia bacterium]
MAAGFAEDPHQSLPPKQWDKKTLSRFPEDPLGRLKGPRPSLRGSKPVSTGGTSGGVAAPDGKFAWSKIISAETVANEIKSSPLELADAVKNAGVFKAGGNRQVRRQFSVLAVMFGIAAEYDQSIRWQQIAPGARTAFARAASNAKAADDNTYNETKSRLRDLEELVRGGTVEFALPAAGDVKWSQVAERRLLMSRLELAFDKRLRPATSNAQQFGKGRDQVVYEAEIIAALAEVIGREGYEFSDDAEYVKLAKGLKQHALEVAAAAKENNFAEVQRTTGELGKSCSNCHGSYKQ